MSDAADPMAWVEKAEMEPKKLNDLSDYAVLTRYPGDDPTLEEARDALEIAKAVRRFARKLLNV
jgi:hypothetical protein